MPYPNGFRKKVKKKLPWVSEETGRKLQKVKYIVLLVLMLIYALGFTKKFHGTSPWEVFSMLYTGKIPDASYLAGWVIFVLILVGMCLKERFFCQYLCPMGAIFAWLPTLPFSVLDRDRSNCIPKCRACEIKCCRLSDQKGPEEWRGMYPLYAMCGCVPKTKHPFGFR